MEFLLLILNYLRSFSSVSIADFEQVGITWLINYPTRGVSFVDFRQVIRCSADNFPVKIILRHIPNPFKHVLTIFVKSSILDVPLGSKICFLGSECAIWCLYFGFRYDAVEEKCIVQSFSDFIFTLSLSPQHQTCHIEYCFIVIIVQVVICSIIEQQSDDLSQVAAFNMLQWSTVIILLLVFNSFFLPQEIGDVTCDILVRYSAVESTLTILAGKIDQLLSCRNRSIFQHRLITWCFWAFARPYLYGALWRCCWKTLSVFSQHQLITLSITWLWRLFKLWPVLLWINSRTT